MTFTTVRRNGIHYTTDETGRHFVECEGCESTGETGGLHLSNCDVDGCETCASSKECRDCAGTGMVECGGCEHCEECEGVDVAA